MARVDHLCSVLYVNHIVMSTMGMQGWKPGPMPAVQALSCCIDDSVSHWWSCAGHVVLVGGSKAARRSCWAEHILM
jgi:hypothetical protein